MLLLLSFSNLIQGKGGVSQHDSTDNLLSTYEMYTEKSSQDPDRRTLYGYSWISIQVIPILFAALKPQKIRMVEKIPTI